MVVRRMTRQKPGAAAQWSRRVMARATDLSRTFKVSNDPHFAEKLEDIVGLHLNAPVHAPVFCCDEKCQAHLILGNCAAHKHPKLKAWLAKHPRFHLHFTPTSASWLNLLERFFRDLTTRRLRRGVFRSLSGSIFSRVIA